MLKEGQQFEVESLDELMEAYRGLNAQWDTYFFDCGIDGFYSGSRFVRMDSDGCCYVSLCSFDKQGYETIPNPFKKKEISSNKNFPMYEGLLKYFPDALKEVSNVSLVGNNQHNNGEELHWDRSKSSDHKDALLRHLTKAGERDDDSVRHSAKVAWRALASLQIEIENDK